MTETEYNLRKENLQLRMALIQREQALSSIEHERCRTELAAMGDNWVPPPPGMVPASKGKN